MSLSSTTDADARATFAQAAPQLLPEIPIKPVAKAPSGDLGGKIVAGTPRHITIPAIVTAGTTVVGLGLWIGFGLDARSHYNECQADVTSVGYCSDGRRSGIKHLDLGADIGWGLALASAVATGVIYMTSGESTHLIVTPTESGAAVSAIGRF